MKYEITINGGKDIDIVCAKSARHAIEKKMSTLGCDYIPGIKVYYAEDLRGRRYYSVMSTIGKISATRQLPLPEHK